MSADRDDHSMTAEERSQDPMRLNRNNVVLIAAIAVAYAVLVPLAYRLGSISIPLFFSISIIMPLICGLLFGAYSAIGITAGAIVASLLMDLDMTSCIELVLASGAATLCIYRLFQSMKKSGGNDYIYDSRSLFSFLVASSSISLVFYHVLSLVGESISDSSIENFLQIRFDVVWIALIIGALIILIVAMKHQGPVMLHPVREDKWRHVFFIPLAITVFLAIFSVDMGDHNTYLIAFFILSMALFGLFGPSKRTIYNGSEFGSLKFKGFASQLILSLFLSMILVIVSDVLYSSFDLPEKIRQRITAVKTLSVVLVFMFFTAGVFLVERQITRPIYDIASIVRNDGDANRDELTILSDRLDFVADNKTMISGNDFTLFIGLTKHDGSSQFETPYAKRIVDDICLKYVGGYISSTEAVGGYKGHECSVSENVLSYRILGASDDMIENILRDVTEQLEQESILVIKNGISKWYYFRKDQKQ